MVNCGSLLQLDLVYLWHNLSLFGAIDFAYFSVQGLTANSPTEVNRSILAVAICCGSIFLFCYFGSNLTEKFEHIGDSINKSAWHLYPIEIRKIMPFILRNCQKPIELSGYLNMKCTRSFFVQVKMVIPEQKNAKIFTTEFSSHFSWCACVIHFSWPYGSAITESWKTSL